MTKHKAKKERRRRSGVFGHALPKFNPNEEEGDNDTAAPVAAVPLAEEAGDGAWGGGAGGLLHWGDGDGGGDFGNDDFSDFGGDASFAAPVSLAANPLVSPAEAAAMATDEAMAKTAAAVVAEAAVVSQAAAVVTEDEAAVDVVAWGALTAERLDASLAAFPPGQHVASAVALAAAACLALGDGGGDRGSPLGALAPLFCAVVAAERTVAGFDPKQPPQASTVPPASPPPPPPPLGSKGCKRVSFATHDFSTVSPPVDTAEKSEAAVEAAVGALEAVLDAKRVTGSALLAAAAKALVAVGGALAAIPGGESGGSYAAFEAANALRSAAAAQGLAVGTVAASASLLAAEFACPDGAAALISGGVSGGDGGGGGEEERVGPLRARLASLVSSAVRFHLRRLLNAPPPPATTPAASGPSASLSASSGKSYAERGCRSEAHTLFRFGPAPTDDGAAMAAPASGSAAADGAVGCMLALALAALHPATLPATGAGGSGGGSDAAACVAALGCGAEPARRVAAVRDAVLLLEASRARRFLNQLLEWPGLHEAVAAHAAAASPRSGGGGGGWSGGSSGRGWECVERFCACAAKHCGAQLAHFGLLADVGALRRLVAAPLPREPSRNQLVQLAAGIANLRKHHAAAIAASAVAATGAAAGGSAGASAAPPTGKGRRKGKGGAVGSGELAALVEVLVSDVASFPSLAEASDDEPAS